MLYPNGQVPLTVVSVVLGSGYDSKGRFWAHRLTPSMAARWQFAVNYAKNKWGRAFKIKAGANAYRDLAWQKIARADACAAGNCNGASVPGYSSHGGNWGGRDCLAIDVDPNGLSWPQVWEACRAAGFECGRITQAISGIPGGEPWHIIDFAAFVALAGDGSTPFPEEDDNMPLTDDDIKRIWTYQLGNKQGGPGAVYGRAADWITNMSDLVAAIPRDVWRVMLAGRNPNGTPIVPPVVYPAEVYLTGADARAGALLKDGADVDASAVASAIVAQLGLKLAGQVADELAKRLGS